MERRQFGRLLGTKVHGTGWQAQGGGGERSQDEPRQPRLRYETRQIRGAANPIAEIPTPQRHLVDQSVGVDHHALIGKGTEIGDDVDQTADPHRESGLGRGLADDRVSGNLAVVHRTARQRPGARRG